MGRRRRYQGLQRWGLQECSLPDLEDGGHSFRQSGERTRQTRRTRPAQTGSTRTHLCQTLGTGVFLAGRSPFPAHTEQDTGTQRKERSTRAGSQRGNEGPTLSAKGTPRRQEQDRRRLDQGPRGAESGPSAPSPCRCIQRALIHAVAGAPGQGDRGLSDAPHRAHHGAAGVGDVSRSAAFASLAHFEQAYCNSGGTAAPARLSPRLKARFHRPLVSSTSPGLI